MLVAALVVGLKLMVGIENRSVVNHNTLCYSRLRDHVLAASADHRLRRVRHLLMLRRFCKQQSLYHHQLL